MGRSSPGRAGSGLRARCESSLVERFGIPVAHLRHRCTCLDALAARAGTAAREPPWWHEQRDRLGGTTTQTHGTLPSDADSRESLVRSSFLGTRATGRGSAATSRLRGRGSFGPAPRESPAAERAQPQPGDEDRENGAELGERDVRQEELHVGIERHGLRAVKRPQGDADDAPREDCFRRLGSPALRSCL